MTPGSEATRRGVAAFNPLVSVRRSSGDRKRLVSGQDRRASPERTAGAGSGHRTPVASTYAPQYIKVPVPSW